jgi:hypothetical protein
MKKKFYINIIINIIKEKIPRKHFFFCNRIYLYKQTAWIPDKEKHHII